MAVMDVRFRQHLRRGGELALLAYIDHPDGENYLWSRSGNLNWDGHIWRGVGALGKISGISKTTTLEVKQVTLELSGVPADFIGNLSARVRNRSARVWLAAISRQKVVGQPYVIIDDKMDYQTLRMDDSGSAAISITISVGFWTIERAVNKAWTHEEQQVKFEGDTGLSQLPLLANKQSNWRLSA